MTHQSGAGDPRGPKGYFKGSRKQHLKTLMPKYRALKKGNREKFWHSLFSGWWQRYPWSLGDVEEPPTDDPEKMRQLASVAPGEEALKAEVERQTYDVR